MLEKLKKIARKFGILAKPMRIFAPPRSSIKIEAADKSKISAEQGLKHSRTIPRSGVRGK